MILALKRTFDRESVLAVTYFSYMPRVVWLAN
jgi:hypothetical protein